MLETLDLTASIDGKTFRSRRLEIETELSRVQREAREAGLGVIVIFEGWNFSGKSECVRYLAEPMDPRGHKVHVMYPPTAQERSFPFARRYWLRLPAHGQIALFLRSWYYHVLDERIHGGKQALETIAAFEEIRMLEKMLTDDGNLIVKFWLHIDKAEQKKRRRLFEKGKFRRWRVGPDDPKQHKLRTEYTRAVEEMLTATSTDFARWYPIPANDRRFARVAVATKLINRIKDELALLRRRQTSEPVVVSLGSDHVAAPADDTTSVLRLLDESRTLQEQEYHDRLAKAQRKLADLQYECVDRKRSVVMSYMGWDAAGKGGVIRRLTSQLDPRYFDVHPIAAPRGEEADHHYLWRFWKAVPAMGHWAIFDRSWYERVLVERVEGFATVPQWRRSYGEINDFESALFESGYILIKFWLHITPEVQLSRFKEREATEYKNYKITDDDWRNREKRTDYEPAVEDMVQRTSTSIAPWSVVPANDKRFARVFILESCVAQIEAGLQRKLSRLRRSF